MTAFLPTNDVPVTILFLMLARHILGNLVADFDFTPLPRAPLVLPPRPTPGQPTSATNTRSAKS